MMSSKGHINGHMAAYQFILSLLQPPETLVKIEETETIRDIPHI